MDSRQLTCFLAVAEAKSFTQAAAKLNMSQPPLTVHVQRLEQHLGVKLFERTTRTVSLTAAGEALYREGQAVLKQFIQLEKSVRLAAAGRSGRLVLGYVEAAISGYLPPSIQAYHEQFPDVEVVFREMTSLEQFDALARGRIQIGFVRQTPPMSLGATVLRVSRDPFVLVTSPAHRLAHRNTAVDIAELAGEPFVMMRRSREPAVHETMTSACERAGFSMRITQRANQIHTVLALASQGIGISLAARSVVLMSRQKLAILELAPTSALNIDLYAVWIGHKMSPSAQRFVEVMATRSPSLLPTR